MMNTKTDNDSFRVRDCNGSTFSVEHRPKDTRLTIATLAGREVFVYLTPEQWKALIFSENKTLVQT